MTPTLCQLSYPAIRKQERLAVSAGGPRAPRGNSSYKVFKTFRCEVTDSYGILLICQRTIFRISERASSPLSTASITSNTFSLHPAMR